MPGPAPEGVSRARDARRYPDAPTWLRRVLLGGLAVFVLAGLLNTFGQAPAATQADATSASLRITAPTDVRGGPIYQVRIDVAAHRRLIKPRLVFSQAWFQGMTLNSLAPQPSTESSRNGDAVFQLSPIFAGNTATYWFYFQVNPTNVGWQEPENLQLKDGRVLIASIHRTVTIYP
jgi:hypothetical protein